MLSNFRGLPPNLLLARAFYICWVHRQCGYGIDIHRQEASVCYSKAKEKSPDHGIYMLVCLRYPNLFQSTCPNKVLSLALSFLQLKF